MGKILMHFFGMFFIAASLLGGLPTSNYKDAIIEYERRSQDASVGEKSEQLAKLAIIYYRDQNQEKAFQTFLSALDYGQSNSSSRASEAEQILYEKALKTYLEQGTVAARETAEKIVHEFSEVLENHNDYHLLGFVIAAAYANQGRFEEFFDRFYTSYLNYPDHHMVYKTRAVLHIKLLERARTAEERDVQKQGILSNVSMAIEKNENDHSLYKLMIAFSSEKEKAEIVHRYINKIIDQGIMIPRSDIAFYVQQCISSDQRDLARRFISKVRERYQYSRAINDAEMLLLE